MRSETAAALYHHVFGTAPVKAACGLYEATRWLGLGRNVAHRPEAELGGRWEFESRRL